MPVRETASRSSRVRHWSVLWGNGQRSCALGVTRLAAPCRHIPVLRGRKPLSAGEQAAGRSPVLTSGRTSCECDCRSRRSPRGQLPGQRSALSGCRPRLSEPAASDLRTPPALWLMCTCIRCSSSIGYGARSDRGRDPEGQQDSQGPDRLMELSRTEGHSRRAAPGCPPGPAAALRAPAWRQRRWRR